MLYTFKADILFKNLIKQSDVLSFASNLVLMKRLKNQRCSSWTDFIHVNISDPNIALCYFVFKRIFMKCITISQSGLNHFRLTLKINRFCETTFDLSFSQES